MLLSQLLLKIRDFSDALSLQDLTLISMLCNVNLNWNNDSTSMLTYHDMKIKIIICNESNISNIDPFNQEIIQSENAVGSILSRSFNKMIVRYNQDNVLSIRCYADTEYVYDIIRINEDRYRCNTIISGNKVDIFRINGDIIYAYITRGHILIDGYNQLLRYNIDSGSTTSSDDSNHNPMMKVLNIIKSEM